MGFTRMLTKATGSFSHHRSSSIFLGTCAAKSSGTSLFWKAYQYLRYRVIHSKQQPALTRGLTSLSILHEGCNV